MNDAILAALIAVAGSIIVQLLISRDSKRKDSAERAREQQRLDDKLERIDEKITEHNAYGAKFAALSEQMGERFDSLKQSILLIERDILYIKEGRFEQKDTKSA